MSWIDSLKKIKNRLTGNAGDDAFQEESTEGFTTYTVRQLEELFSKSTFDSELLERVLAELQRREKEIKSAGKEISPSIYKLRFVVFERIQQLKEENSLQGEREGLKKTDEIEQAIEENDKEADEEPDPKQDIPEVVAREVLSSTLSTVGKKAAAQQSLTRSSEAFTRTQFESAIGNNLLEIRIGLDFGTAFSKVVLGTPLGARAVPLSEGLDATNVYLLPGVLSIENSGECHLGMVDGCTHVDDLKMKIIDSAGELQLEFQVQVVAYLALLFRKVRWWWIDQQGAPEIFRDDRTIWFVNSGLPTESLEGAIPSLYHRLILAAWAASVDEGPINVKQIKETCELSMIDQSIIVHDDEGQEEYLEEGALELLPEFLAQTAVYISHDSIDKRRLHAIVDIGAGTIDMTIFNVYEWEGVIRHGIFGKKVVPLGANYLINNRLSSLGKSLEMAGQFYIEDVSDKEFSKKVGVSMKALEGVDGEFLNQIINHFIDLRNLVVNDPDTSNDRDLLEKGIKILLSGGGARIDAYKNRMKKFEEKSQFGQSPNTIEFGQLPDLQFVEDRERQLVAPGLDRRDYDRLSVAYGLSDDPWNLAELLDEEQVRLLSLRAAERNRATRENAGGAYWDDPNAPPVM